MMLDKLIQSDIKDQIKSQKEKARKNDENINSLELDNLIDMLKEFDYKKNGKEDSIHFLSLMIMYFNQIDF